MEGVAILILVDFTLQSNEYSWLFFDGQERRNPYFSGLYLAIKMEINLCFIYIIVAILILVDFTLQYLKDSDLTVFADKVSQSLF